VWRILTLPRVDVTYCPWCAVHLETWRLVRQRLGRKPPRIASHVPLEHAAQNPAFCIDCGLPQLLDNELHRYKHVDGTVVTLCDRCCAERPDSHQLELVPTQSNSLRR
jgi:ferredoxin